MIYIILFLAFWTILGTIFLLCVDDVHLLTISLMISIGPTGWVILLCSVLLLSLFSFCIIVSKITDWEFDKIFRRKHDVL